MAEFICRALASRGRSNAMRRSGSLKRTIREVRPSPCRHHFCDVEESTQPTLPVRTLLVATSTSRTFGCHARQHVLKRSDVSKYARNPYTQIGRQKIQTLKTAFNSRGLKRIYIPGPDSPHLDGVREPFFAPILCQLYCERSNRREERSEFRRNIREDNYCFSLSFLSLDCCNGLTLKSDLLRTTFSEKIGSLSKLPHGDAGNNGSQDPPESNDERSRSKHCCKERDCNRPSVPPNNTITYARLHAWANAAPKIANPTHSLIPLWTGRHSAMPPRWAEISYG